MAYTTTADRTNAGLDQVVVERVESGEAVRVVQNALLSELPGVTFAFLTLAYVVFSLMGLS